LNSNGVRLMLRHESENPWEGACLLTSEGEQIVVLAADCPWCRAERAQERVKELEVKLEGIRDHAEFERHARALRAEKGGEDE
jgi:hypothetical protein